MRGDERDNAAGRRGCAAMVVAGLPETTDVATDVAWEAFICEIGDEKGWTGVVHGRVKIEETREERETRNEN